MMENPLEVHTHGAWQKSNDMKKETATDTYSKLRSVVLVLW